MDVGLTVFFAADLVRRLTVARHRVAYLTQGWGWVDVLATFPILRILRIVRVVKVSMVMGRLGGPLRAFSAFFCNKATGACSRSCSSPCW